MHMHMQVNIDIFIYMIKHLKFTLELGCEMG